MEQYRSRDDVRFVVVYQREPHAGQMAFRDVPQPTDRAERVELAKKTLAELQLDVDLWIDDSGDQSRALFGDLPNSAIVIDASGTVRLKLSWCEPEVLRGALPEIEWMQREQRVPLAEAGFLAAIAKPPADDEGARHHRRTMLAALAVAQPRHANRCEWLRELEKDGPPEQRAWARQMREAPSEPAKPPPAEPPKPAATHATEPPRH